MLNRLRLLQLSLRWRLTLWYLLTLGAILLLFASFLYWQLRADLLDQLDAALRLAAAQTAVRPTADGAGLTFADPEASGLAAGQSTAVYLTDAAGRLWARAGATDDAPAPQALPRQPGLATILAGDDGWRVFSQPVGEGAVRGWLHVAGSLDPVSDPLERLWAVMLVGGPLALALAGLGGIFLASRALRPVDALTRTAQAITAGDLSRRMAYSGPADELGRLAQTFDAMLDRLQAAFERERRFTGDAAHELRTPLAALKGQIDVTLSRPRQPAVYVETLQEMAQQVERLIRLSNDLLFMARLDQGAFQIEREPIAPRDFLGAVVEQIRPLAAAKAIALEESIPDGLTLVGDMDLLIRLFLNLLDNAVKYTPQNGLIVVAAAQADGKLTVSIRDSGPGIPPAHLPHLFERFYRVAGDRARAGGGAGLGLAIAHEIARAHGGALRVESKLGAGTAVFVQLPAGA